MKHISFKRQTISQGRRGNVKTIGVEVFLYSDKKSIFISPINSKGYVANAWLSFPVEEWENIKNTIEDIVSQEKNLVV